MFIVNFVDDWLILGEEGGPIVATLPRPVKVFQTIVKLFSFSYTTNRTQLGGAPICIYQLLQRSDDLTCK